MLTYLNLKAKIPSENECFWGVASCAHKEAKSPERDCAVKLLFLQCNAHIYSDVIQPI